MLENSRRCLMCCEETGETITVLGQMICAHCEREICQTSVEQPQYDWYVWRLKQVWQTLETLG